MSNFWKSLPSPFTILAPMDDVTDVVFREIIARSSPPDVFFTEFTSADALDSRGRDIVIRKLRFTQNQRPIVAQIWGAHPQAMQKAAALVVEMGFDGVDINMGCPVENIMKKGAGSGHIGNYDHSKEIIQAVQKGAAGKIAVSVKTRLGKQENIITDWATFLLEQKLDALIIHGRTAIQQSKDEADWSAIGDVARLRDRCSPNTVIIGNGDVKSYKEVVEKSKNYGVDGVMIGRGIFTDPWIFEKKLNTQTHEPSEFIQLLKNHLTLFIDTWGDTKNFELMKKFFKMYIQDYPGASQLRQQLMACKTYTQIMAIIS